MVVVEYALIVLLWSWPLLVVGYSVSWILLRHRTNFRLQIFLSWMALSLAIYVVSALVVWLMWPREFDGPMYFTYIHGPSLVAALLVFPAMYWWIHRHAT